MPHSGPRWKRCVDDRQEVAEVLLLLRCCAAHDLDKQGGSLYPA